jgi:hypothetical protein
MADEHVSIFVAAVPVPVPVDGAGVPRDEDPVALYDTLVATTPTLFACGFLRGTLISFVANTLPAHLARAEKALQQLRDARASDPPTTRHEAEVRAAGYHLNLKRIEVLHKLKQDIADACNQCDRDEDEWHALLLEAVNVWIVDTMHSLYASNPGSVTATLFRTLEDMHLRKFSPETTLAFKLKT